MTATIAPAETGSVTIEDQATAAARVYYAAQAEIARLSDTTVGRKLQAAQDDAKTALNALATLYPANPDHAAAQHDVRINRQKVETFLHREDTTIKWAKVVETLRPDLDVMQRTRLDSLIGHHASTRRTKKFL